MSRNGKNNDDGIKNIALNLFEEKSKVFKDKATELSEKTMDEILDDTKVGIRKKPFKSIGIAMIVGIFIGFLLKSDR